MKYKIPEGCNDLVIAGSTVEIIDGVVEVDYHHNFLIENGFTPIFEETITTSNEDATTTGGEELPNIEDVKKEADDLGITYAQNIGVKKLLEKIAEFKLATTTGGEA